MMASLLAALLFLVPTGLAGAGPSAKIEQLAWLSGDWVSTSNERTVEERWSAPAGGLMLGTGRTTAPGRPTEFEFLRVIERDGGLVYIAQPGGGPATEFALRRIGPDEAVFENSKHDFPQRLVYRNTATGRLSVRVENLAGDQGFTLELSRR